MFYFSKNKKKGKEIRKVKYFAMPVLTCIPSGGDSITKKPKKCRLGMALRL